MATDNKKSKISGDLIRRLESGQGFGEAISGRTGDILKGAGKAASLKGAGSFGKKVYMETFGGKDIFSAYMRGRLAKDKDKEEKQKEEKIKPEPVVSSKDDEEQNAYLKIIAKNALSLHMLARDVNVLRQNIVQLTKIEAANYNKEKSEKQKIKAAEKADIFFSKEDEREAALEAEKKSILSKKEDSKTPTKESAGKEGGFLGGVIDLFKNGLMSGLKFLLNPGAILKLLGKVFVIGTIIVSLFKGITAGFEKWKETGSLKEALIEGLGAIVDFLSFGFFGKDTVQKLFGEVEQFLDPIVGSITGVVSQLKEWVVNNVGIPEINIPIPDWVQYINKNIPKSLSVGPYYPFKKNPKSKEPEKSAAPAAGKPAAKETAKPAAAAAPEAATSAPTSTPSAGMPEFPATGDKTKDSAIQDFFGGGKSAIASGDPSAMFSNLLDLKEKYKDYTGSGTTAGTGATVRDPADNFKSVAPTPSKAAEPAPAPTPTPAPTPAPTPSAAPTAEELQDHIEGLKKRKKDQKEKNERLIKKYKDPSSKSYDPERAKEMEQDLKEQLDSYDKDIAEAEKQLAGLKKGGSKSSTPSSSGSAAPTVSASAGSSESGGGASMGSLSGGTTSSSTPSPSPSAPASSGASLSTASSDVAEGQRMEASASSGSFVNAPVTNSSVNNTSQAKGPSSDVYDSDLIKLMAPA